MNGSGGAKVTKELHGVFILGDIVAGWENGFMVPPAGGDVEWLKKNMPAFEKLASEGSEEWKGVVEEVRERKLIG